MQGRLAVVLTCTIKHWVWVLVIAAWAASQAAYADDPDEEFRQGTAAYRAGKFEQAVMAFEAAYNAGLRSPNLDFNLGLAYLKTGEYEQAKEAFRRLQENPEYSAIADYHLGLVAVKQGEIDEAITHIRKAEVDAATPQLRNLARLALRRLGAEPATYGISSYLFGGFGYDSNLALLSEDVRLDSTDGEDGFLEFFGVLDYPIGKEGVTFLRGSLFLHEYVSDNDFSQEAAEVGVFHLMRWEAWQTRISGDIGTFFYGHENLQNTGSLAIEGKRLIAASPLRLRYRLTRVEGGSDFEYLDGWRHQLRAGYEWRVYGFLLKADYDFEANDREDLARGSEFFSQSPTRQGLRLRARQLVNDRLSLEWSARYRDSEYRDNDRFLVDGDIARKKREETLWQAGLSSRWRVTRGKNILLAYEYSDNDSNFDTFSYDRHLILVGYEWIN